MLLFRLSFLVHFSAEEIADRCPYNHDTTQNCQFLQVWSYDCSYYIGSNEELESEQKVETYVISDFLESEGFLYVSGPESLPFYLYQFYDTEYDSIYDYQTSYRSYNKGNDIQYLLHRFTHCLASDILILYLICMTNSSV